MLSKPDYFYPKRRYRLHFISMPYVEKHAKYISVYYLMYRQAVVLLWAAVTLSKSYQKLQLYGGGTDGAYFMEIWVGTPPQKQRVMIDTGSQLAILKCSQCKNCQGSYYKNYEADSSSSSRKVFCNSEEYYCANSCTQEGQQCLYKQVFYMGWMSSEGAIKKDLAYFGLGTHQAQAVQLIFGCETHASSKFQTLSYAGILGLAPYPHLNKLYDWFALQNVPKVMSVCLAAQGGYLELGTPEEKQPKQPADAIYATFVDNFPSLITKQVTGMRLGEVDLLDKWVIDKKGVAIDTGTTDNMLPEAKLQQAKALLDKACLGMMLNCQTYNSSALPISQRQTCYMAENPFLLKSLQDYVDSSFPAFEVTLNKSKILTKASRYFHMYEAGSASGLLCLAFQPDTTGQYILGNKWLVDKKLTINLDQAFLQITTDSDCAYRQQNTFAFKSRFSAQTAASYLFLLLAFVLLMLLPRILEKVRALRRGGGKRREQLVEQRGAKSGQA